VGGISAHVTELAAALQRRGHEVHVFTRIGPGQPGYDSIHSVHYHRCVYDRHPDFVHDIERMCSSFMWNLGEVEHFVQGRFDVIHGHDWLCARALAQARHERRAPTVLTMHSTEYGRCGNEHRGGLSGRISHIEWEGTQTADRVICVSALLRQETMRIYAVPVDKVTVIHNGVSAHQFEGAIDSGAVKQQYGLEREDSMVLFAGRMATQKGPDLLLEGVPGLVRHHPRARFVFAGRGDLLDSLQRRADHLGVASATRFLGHRAGPELVNLFKTADIICVPSRNEPFGIVILEGWAAGKPAVATRNGGPAEFLDHGRDGILTIDHPDSIAWGVGTLLNDPERARWLGENGRHKVKTKYGWDRLAEQTEAVYARVCSRT
jgi:glycosyltransferase involved in cell wall biosynthesis